MKGIILAGGLGTRLFPSTNAITKHLIPIYDKPMIYYPLSTLMLAGIREILIISSPQHLPLLKNLLGNGDKWGISLSYAIQTKPEGIGQAFLIAEEFISNEKTCLILGDNLFFGHNFQDYLLNTVKNIKYSTIYAYRVRNPSEYGVVNFDNNEIAISIEEKPTKPSSKYAVTGLYFYDESVIDIAKSITPSNRGELEITSINQHYLKYKQLNVEILGRGMTWFDAGSHDNLLNASQFVYSIEKRQGLKIACPEEISWRWKWIDDSDLEDLANLSIGSNYGQYLMHLLNDKEY
jgi:glucose-1-phosphate thymidylyltransferase